MVCINGDKGDAAQPLGLPLILFDDREDNIVDVVNKGTKHNVGVVVRKGEVSHRHVHHRNKHLVINSPHDWVYWSWRFARLFPQQLPLDGPPNRHLEADLETRSQPFHISNTEPTCNIFRYRRSPYAESLVKRREQGDIPQPACSSSCLAAVTPSQSSSLPSTSLQTMSSSSTNLQKDARVVAVEQLSPNSSGGGACNFNNKK